jgi:hypothetical protein
MVFCCCQELVAVSEQEYVASAVDLLKNPEKLQNLRNRVNAAPFDALSREQEAGTFVAAVQIAHTAHRRIADLRSQHPPMVFINYDDCVQYILNAEVTPTDHDVRIPVLTSAQLHSVAAVVCEEWFHPLDTAAVNVFGGPLRRGKSVTLS